MAVGDRLGDGDASRLIDEDVPLRSIFLTPTNPRHEPVETEQDAIAWLCEQEDVLPLARDIVRYGLSPLERFALTVIAQEAGSATYYVQEGNRRICALKLLDDPDRAPVKLRGSFEALAEQWTPIKTVSGVIFNDADELRIWLDRTHSGPQDGIGRRNWNADQKQRFYGGSKNALAQAILDYAEEAGMLSKEERRRKLTTAQRILNNEIFQEAIGIDRTSPDGVQRTRPKDEFDVLLRKFVRDLVDGVDVNSRMNRGEIVQYARQISGMPGVTTKRTDITPLVAPKPIVPPTTRLVPRRPDRVRNAKYEPEIAQGLAELGNAKLESLYYSVTSLDIDKHTPLICIGAWAFIETLTAAIGSTTDFVSFLHKGRLNALGVAGDTRAIRSALQRISGEGNTTKHHAISATFSAGQLSNDLATLTPAILACIREAIGGGDKSLAEPEQA